MLKKTAKRAGITKHIHPHLFRHSRATELAKKLTEQQLKIYLGWSGDSKMASTYVHLSGRDVDNAILELNGINPDEEKYNSVILKAKDCFRCGNKNDATARLCSKCGMVLDTKDTFNLKGNEMKQFQDFMMEMFHKWKTSKESEI